MCQFNFLKLYNYRVFFYLKYEYLKYEYRFSEKTADIDMEKYANKAQIPRQDLMYSIADTLDVLPLVLNAADIDSELGLIYTLFVLDMPFYNYRVAANFTATL